MNDLSSRLFPPIGEYATRWKRKKQETSPYQIPAAEKQARLVRRGFEKNPQIKWATPSHSGLSTRSREANEQKTTGRRTSLDRRTGEKARKSKKNNPLIGHVYTKEGQGQRTTDPRQNECPTITSSPKQTKADAKN